MIGDASIPLKKQFELNLLRELKAIIVPGGPGIRRNLYPEIYPLFPELFKFNIPILFLGIGSKFYPGSLSKARKIKLNNKTKQLLNHTIDCGYSIGIRDTISKYILIENGIKDYSLNGCPAWYDLDFIGKKINKPIQIKNIAFSTPMNPYHLQQSKIIINKLKNEFPNTNIFVTFHHGINFADSKRYRKVTKLLRDIASFALRSGCKIMDFSKDLNNLKFYDKCDLHIGYRVHGHIYFLSHRKPSFLISEDSRGVGTLMSLGGKGLPAWRFITEVINQSNLLWRLLTDIVYLMNDKHPFPYLITGINVPKKILRIIKTELLNNFDSYKKIPLLIDYYFRNRMKKFIQSMP